MVVWLCNHWTSRRCRQRLTNFLNILHQHCPNIVRSLNRLILPRSDPTSPSLRPHSNVRLEALHGDRIQVEREEVDAELTIRMNDHNHDTALVPRGSESVVGGVFTVRSTNTLIFPKFRKTPK